MTVKDIYAGALSLTLSRVEDDESIEKFVPPIFNITLGEVFAANNQIREKWGKAPFEKVPYIALLEQENPYEGILDTALQYALASKLLLADDEAELADVYNRQYLSEVASVTPYVAMEVTDVYGKDI
ncbi:MAG: hypothetical protein RR846_10545 [Oscillospiraceae bacterium]